jgi:lipopolysaccharide transport system ATP-binding protein
MYLRLAFSVAAHLEPEILIVDEVLAVGDAEFQKKCLGKMDEVSKNEGRTVLFVSHNSRAIQQLCTKIFYLNEGKMEFEGKVDEGIQRYTGRAKMVSLEKRTVKNKKAYISGYDVKLADDDKKLQVSISVEAVEAIDKTEIAVGLNDPIGNRIITLHSGFWNQQFNLSKGVNEFVCIVSNISLKPGRYSMNVFLGTRYETLDYLDEPIDFELLQSAVYPSGIIPDNSQGYLMTDHKWILKTAAHAGS